ncbi:hypothetical protein GJV26_14155 [Massilia dura]|uniref:Uncharacterized protein n=1 Tax=Pseudoduganella dura TaxID=321982 RepID=A0A6I3XBA7_9BURK|nr:hypothetical protein [Pseudoduganella dura]MUI13597.1 hypothetical protein [Pseudoduganella dura]GGX73963.1 hypothetical protein GCM10007386_01060 [Pseudoduganella dura]
MQQTLTYPTRPRRRLVAGVAISFVLHVLLLAMLRTPSVPPMPSHEPRWAQPLTVRILPPPKPMPEPVAIVEPPAGPAKPVKQAARPASITPSASARVAAGRPEPERAELDTASPPAMTMVPAQPAEPAPAEGVPDFDPDAARGAARKMANNLEPPPMNWAAAKLNKGKEWKETKEQRFGRNVANATRGDCRTAYAGAGLLAPLIMLADKKDSGCKW